MRILLDNSVFTANQAVLGQVLTLLREDASFLRSSYPNFNSWLFNKVVPGILSGERTVIVEMRANEVAGVMILKHSQSEKKLCTLRIRPHYESRGMGVRLFDAAFEILKTERPLLSVSEKAMPKFENLFRHFGFSPEAIYEDRYLPRVRELSYNGLLDTLDAEPEVSTCTYRISRTRSKNSFSTQLRHSVEPSLGSRLHLNLLSA